RYDRALIGCLRRTAGACPIVHGASRFWPEGEAERMIDVRRAYSSRGFRAAAAALVALLVALLVLAVGPAGRQRAPSPDVRVFPIAGSRLGPPGTQITFRGVPANQIGKITVTGSVSGNHTGKVLPDSDGRGGSFMPDKSFTPGERVTVSTGLNI